VVRSGSEIDCLPDSLAIEAGGPVAAARGHRAHAIPHRWTLHRLDNGAWHTVATVEALRAEWRDTLLPIAAAMLAARRPPPDVGLLLDEAEHAIRAQVRVLRPSDADFFLADLAERLWSLWAGVVCPSVSLTRQTDPSPPDNYKHYRVQEILRGRGCGGREKKQHPTSGEKQEVRFRELLNSTQRSRLVELQSEKKALQTVATRNRIETVAHRLSLTELSHRMRTAPSAAERSSAASELGRLAGRRSVEVRRPRLSETMTAASRARWDRHRAQQAEGCR
jgi:hypothetical protein